MAGRRPGSCVIALVACAVLGACSGDPDGVAPLPDAPLTTHLSLFNECRTIPIDEAAGIAFPDTFAGKQSAVLGIQVQNDGPTDIGSRANLKWEISGPDAADFVRDDDSVERLTATCSGGYHGGGLAVGQACTIRLSFRPTTPGMKTASLTVSYAEPSPIVTQTFALSGMAIASAATVFASEPQLFVDSFLYSVWGGPVRIVNDATSSFSPADVVVTGPFSLFAVNCPAQLTSGGACDFDVERLSTEDACPTGELTTTGGAFHVPIRTWGTPPPPPPPPTLTLAVDSVYGSVTVDPLGVTCSDPSCSYPVGSDPITLTAVGGHFLGWWDGTGPNACGTSRTCVVPGGASAYRIAKFASTSALSLTITISGIGTVNTGVAYDPICTTSCTRWVEPGTQVYLLESTTGTFQMWSGDCTGTTETCNVGTVVNNRAVTATFVP